MNDERGADMYKVVRALGGDVNAKIRNALGVDGGLVHDPVELVEFEMFIERMKKIGVEYCEREERGRKLIIAEGVRENLKGLETDLSKLAVMHGHRIDETVNVKNLFERLMGEEE